MGRGWTSMVCTNFPMSGATLYPLPPTHLPTSSASPETFQTPQGPTVSIISLLPPGGGHHQPHLKSPHLLQGFPV